MQLPQLISLLLLSLNSETCIFCLLEYLLKEKNSLRKNKPHDGSNWKKQLSGKLK